MNGMGGSISTERPYTRRLQVALARGLQDAYRSNMSACFRSFAIITEFTVMNPFRCSARDSAISEESIS
jgi:hypothetical protein